MARGTLRIFLGAAPGVGKTYAMLNEAHRRSERGTDVVVGIIETHGRPRTAEQIGDLEVLPRRRMSYRDREFEELDVDAVLERRPAAVLIDELAHTNVPGSRNEKRWQDVEELLAAGIDVISTLNIQHLESMNDVVEDITGVAQQETIPDDVVRAADQIQLVDMTPEALRRRMAHGNIYGSDRVDAALANYFREGNLGALRELALMWVADRVDDSLLEYRRTHGVERPWETRERVVVALTGAPHGAALIRRASRIASRSRAELYGVHIRPSDGLSVQEPVALAGQRELLAALGGIYAEVAGEDVARTLVDFARSRNATQVVLGATQRSRWDELTKGSVVNRVIRASGSIDVHVISADQIEDEEDEPSLRDELGVAVRRSAARWPLDRRRVIAWVLAVALPILLTLLLTQLRDVIDLPAQLLVLLAGVIVVSVLGGVAPAVVGAVLSFLLANWYFTPPFYTLTVGDPENLLSLIVFVAVALVVSLYVSAATRRSVEASQARAEAETLAALAGTVASNDDPLPALVEQLRRAFGARAVSVVGTDDGGEPVIEASAGPEPPRRASEGSTAVAIGERATLVLDGAEVDTGSLSTLQAFAGQLDVALERRNLRAESALAAQVAQVNELRAALLAAVSHDLRTPLAAIKAAASGLGADDFELPPADRAELVATIDAEVDRLTDLITNLLGMSRIHAGTVELEMRPVGLDEVVPRALAGIDPDGRVVEMDLDETMPRVLADAGLLERVVANLVDNACRYSPPDRPVIVRADEHAGSVLLFVIDHGPGIAVADRDRVFEPFQRLGEHAGDGGTGLGLAVAQGFTQLMGGRLEVTDTPGGGTTMVLGLPAVQDSSAPVEAAT